MCYHMPMQPFVKRETRGFWPKILVIYVGLALLAASFFAGSYVGYHRGERAVVPQGQGHIINAEQKTPDFLSKDVDFGLYWRIWNLLKDRYVKRPVSDTELFYGSLRGMVGSLGDPYTVFFDPETTKLFKQELAGKFEGIGAQIGMKDDVLTIIAPLPNSPAERIGLKADDQVVKIDGTSTLGMTVDEAVSRIKGPKDTKVTLTITRTGWKDPRDFVITRAEITVKSVETKMRDDGIAVVDIFEFGDTTSADFEQAVLELIVKNPKGIILDLRNNPGGYLTAAVDTAGAWIPEGEVVVVEQNKDRTEYPSPGSAQFKGIPTVVLVNGGSASGAEILAGALQDYQYGYLIGTQTFGKGSVQDYQELPDGSAVKFTIAEWLTPLGRSINKVGIAPDEVVKFTEDEAKADQDPQMDRAVEFLKSSVKK